MLLGDICLIAYLSLRAYRDGISPQNPAIESCLVLLFDVLTVTVDSLEHYEVPIFGRLANSFVDDE